MGTKRHFQTHLWRDVVIGFPPPKNTAMNKLIHSLRHAASSPHQRWFHASNLRAWMLVSGLWSLVFACQAIEPSVTQLHPPSSDTFGQSTAMNDQWIVVGDPSDTNEIGAVQVFARATGKWLRTLRATAGPTTSRLGWSVALRGNLVLTGAPDSLDQGLDAGAAVVFDASTGKQLFRLLASDGNAQSSFGDSVAISGKFGVIGAPVHDEVGAADAGAVYVFDLTTGNQRTKIAGSAASQKLGYAVAASGYIFVAGAPGTNGDKGAAFLYAIGNGQALGSAIVATAAFGDKYGQSVTISGNRFVVASGGNNTKAYGYDVITSQELFHIDFQSFPYSLAAHGNTLVVGLPFSTYGGVVQSGVAQVFDLTTGSFLRQFVSPVILGSEFGRSVALSGNGMAVGAFRGGSANTSTAFLFDPIAAPPPTTTLVKVGDAAAGALDTKFAGFTHTVINNQGDVAIAGSVAGSGAPAGKTQGLWSSLLDGFVMSHLLRAGDPYAAGIIVNTVAPPVLNQDNYAVFSATLKGVGVTSANDAVLFHHDGTTLVPVLREGTIIPGGTGSVASWPKVVQSSSQSFHYTSIAYTLKPAAGIVSAINDTGVVTLSNGGSSVINVQENDSAPGAGAAFGQFIGRLAGTYHSVHFTAALQSAATTNQAVYRISGANAPVLRARRGDFAPGCGTATFATFLGETNHPGLFGDETLIRATLSGGGTTTATNEGLWSTRSVNAGANTLALVVRKGDPVPTLGGATFASITKYWGITNNCVLFQAVIKGPGITSANDTGLWLAQESGVLVILLREGDSTPDLGDTAKIGPLQQVEVDPLAGHYAVLVSLVSGTSGRDQLLLTGNLDAGNATTLAILRFPIARLRKGIFFQSPLGSTTSILSMALPTTSVEASGAGDTGTGRAINNVGELALTVTFNDKSVHVVTLEP